MVYTTYLCIYMFMSIWGMVYDCFKHMNPEQDKRCEALISGARWGMGQNWRRIFCPTNGWPCLVQIHHLQPFILWSVHRSYWFVWVEQGKLMGLKFSPPRWFGNPLFSCRGSANETWDWQKHTVSMDWFRGKSTLEAMDFTMIMDFSGVIFSFNQSIDTISFEDHDLRLCVLVIQHFTWCKTQSESRWFRIHNNIKYSLAFISTVHIHILFCIRNNMCV